MFDLDAEATLVGFADLVGTTHPAIHKHVKAGTLHPGGSYREWLIAYCDQQRVAASGHKPSSSRARLDLAKAIESETNAELKKRELYRQDGLIVDIAGVRQAMADWITLAKTEMNAAVTRIIAAIESEHGITIDREQLRPDVDAALRSIADYKVESGETGGGSAEQLDSATEDTDD